MEFWWKLCWQGKAEVLGGKPVPMPPPQVPNLVVVAPFSNPHPRSAPRTFRRELWDSVTEYGALVDWFSSIISDTSANEDNSFQNHIR